MWALTNLVLKTPYGKAVYFRVFLLIDLLKKFSSNNKRNVILCREKTMKFKLTKYRIFQYHKFIAT